MRTSQKQFPAQTGTRQSNVSIRTPSVLTVLHNAMVTWNTLHIGHVVEQLRAEGHTSDDTTLSATTETHQSARQYHFDLERYRQTADPSSGETPQAVNGGFRLDVASTRWNASRRRIQN